MCQLWHRMVNMARVVAHNLCLCPLELVKPCFAIFCNVFLQVDEQWSSISMLKWCLQKPTYTQTHAYTHRAYIHTYIHIYPHIERHGDRQGGRLLVFSCIPFPHDFSSVLPTFLGSWPLTISPYNMLVQEHTYIYSSQTNGLECILLFKWCNCLFLSLAIGFTCNI